PGLSCMSAAQQLKREPSVVACFRRANPRIMNAGTLTDRYRGVGVGLDRGRPTARTAVCRGKEFPSNSGRICGICVNWASEMLAGEEFAFLSRRFESDMPRQAVGLRRHGATWAVSWSQRANRRRIGDPKE